MHGLKFTLKIITAYEGNLSVEGMIEWIGELYRYFDYEEIEEDKKVKLFVTRLKGHYYS